MQENAVNDRADKQYDEVISYLPHRSPMVLIDKIVSITEESAASVTDVQAEILKPFLDAKGRLPSWYAIEMMAQTVGLWSGTLNKKAGLPQPAAGFILSCRGLEVSDELFAPQGSIHCEVSLLMHDGNFASFDCKLSQDGGLKAKARLSLFQAEEEKLQEIFSQD